MSDEMAQAAHARMLNAEQEVDELRTALEAANQARVEAEARAETAEQCEADVRAKLAEAEKDRATLESAVETQGKIADELAGELETAQALLTKYERAIGEAVDELERNLGMWTAHHVLESLRPVRAQDTEGE